MTPGRVLVGLETSGRVGSIAVSVDGTVRARAFLGERSGHASALMPALDAVLAEAGVDRRALEGVAVGAGPGSFTGVRVAAAAGKGLCHALRIPLYAVSSLLGAVLTERALPGGAGPWGMATDSPALESADRYVLFDARGDRLFAAAYRLDGRVPEELRPPHFTRLPQLLEDRELVAAAFCGDGAIRHLAQLQQEERVVLPPPLGFPSADGLLLYLARAPETQPLANPFVWEPEYLRETGAERSGEA